ncbi:hypothetical protein AX16_011040 [Volvariella volvacea WC 439]|nr:hypothetical protein AX16_011040 [Volvariella volvacea WC 439]
MILKRKSSPHFSVGIVSSFIVMAISALAPATISIQSVTIDRGEGDVCKVAAMGPSSVAILNSSISSSYPTYQRYSITQEMGVNLREAADFTCLQMKMGMDPTSPTLHDLGFLDHPWSFPSSDSRSGSPQYAVPFPLDLQPSMPTRWRTDAFALRPVCNWQNATESSQIEYLSDRTLNVHNQSLGISFHLDVAPTADNESYVFDIRHASTVLDGRFTIWNTTTNDVPSRGYSIWAIITRSSDDFLPGMVNLTRIPTFLIDSFQIGILICSPGFSIETVEVRNEGTSLFVSPLTTTAREGNLDQRQAELFFTSVFGGFSQALAKTPELPPGNISQVKVGLIFGWALFGLSSLFNEDEMPHQRPIYAEDITPLYAKYLEFATTWYMTGLLGVAYAPVMVSSLAFTASRVYAIISTVLLAILNVINIWAYFRSSRGKVFSLLTAANALHDSGVTEMVRQVKKENMGASAEEIQERFEEESKGHSVTLDNQGTLCLDDPSTLGSRDNVGEREALVPAPPFRALHLVSRQGRSTGVVS